MAESINNMCVNVGAYVSRYLEPPITFKDTRIIVYSEMSGMLQEYDYSITTDDERSRHSTLFGYPVRGLDYTDDGDSQIWVDDSPFNPAYEVM